MVSFGFKHGEHYYLVCFDRAWGVVDAYQTTTGDKLIHSGPISQDGVSKAAAIKLVTEATKPKPDPELLKMKKAELIELADERGISIDKGFRKAEIIDLLTTAPE